MNALASTVGHPLERLELRRALEAYVRRHVPRDDVQDVVQTVLCDALAAPRAPRDDVGLLKFLYTIARRRVVDWHRRAGRERSLPGSWHPALACAESPVEQRSTVSWLLRHAPAGSESARTLDWMVREADGDSLEQIAVAEQLSAPCVRQRVSRLRRALRQLVRAEIALPLLLVVASAVYGAWFFESRRPDPAALQIEAESNRQASAALTAELQGEWRLVEITPAASVNPLRRAVANAQRGELSIRITGRKAELRGPGLRRAVTTWVHATQSGAFAVVVDVDGESVRFNARRDGNRLWLESSSNAWAGSALLERVHGG